MGLELKQTRRYYMIGVHPNPEILLDWSLTNPGDIIRLESNQSRRYYRIGVKPSPVILQDWS